MIEDNYMSLEDFQSFVTYVQAQHSFASGAGKRIKYISPTYDTRTGKIFHVNLRVAGDGLDFSITNENKHRNLKDWLYQWLDNGHWQSIIPLESEEQTDDNKSNRI